MPRRHSMIPPIKPASPRRMRASGRSASVIAEKEREGIARALARREKVKLTKELTTGVGFNKEEFKAMTKDEKTKLQAARQAGLNTVKAILDDVNFYEKGIATPREKRAKMLREAEAKGMPPGGEQKKTLWQLYSPKRDTPNLVSDLDA